ncbi:MAG: NAD(P)H-dependent oxidoreductase [Candidatus Rokuibacteriota bacterium]
MTVARMWHALGERARRDDPIRVALVGAGQMGQGLAATLGRLPGMRLLAVADLDLERARRALHHAGAAPSNVTEALTDRAAQAALARGCAVATTIPDIIPGVPVDVVVDATGDPLQAALTAVRAIEARRHIVLLSVEADVTVGHVLASRAREAGVVYTGAAGDEPAATKELVDFARFVGFEVICAGKGKNNPLDRSATAASLAAEARAKGMNPRMLAEFVDGTKTMVEMACLANATGLVPDVRGMHGARASAAELARVFVPVHDGGVLTRRGVVDFAMGVAPGVFVVIHTDHPILQDELRYLKIGDGPHFALYRPYHLASIETPLSIAAAALCGEATIAPAGPPRAEVVTMAKRALREGDRLELPGEATVYGLIESAEIAAEEGLLPIGLAPDAEVLVDMAPHQPIRWRDVRVRPTPLLKLRSEQDRMFALEVNR